MFPHSSVGQALSRFNSACSGDALAAFEQNDRSGGTGKLAFMTFYSTIKQLTGKLNKRFLQKTINFFFNRKVIFTIKN